MHRVKTSRIFSVTLFSLAVMAVLLRPYFAYQLSVSRHLASNPVALNNLLQRLVKKKDDHHSVDKSELSAIKCIQNKVLPLSSRATSTHHSYKGFALPLKQLAYFTKVFHPCPYYKLFSEFRL